MSVADRGRDLASLRDEARRAAEQFHAMHASVLEQYQRSLTEGINAACERLRLDVAEISGNSPICMMVAEQTTQYVDWLQWSLWDLPHFAVAIRPGTERFSERVASCAFVYLAGRVFDDVIDRHFWYKGKRPTLLSVSAESHPSSDGAESLTLLGGLLLCADGLLRLAEPGDPEHADMLRRLLGSFRRTVVGAILEHADPEDWSTDYYERLIHLKNVDFWRILYTAVDPRRESPLYPFLERYYALAQKLNDVQDFADDERRGQPNLLSLHLRRGPASAQDGQEPASIPPALREELACGVLELAGRAESLPATERAVAMLKLGETLDEAGRAGVFETPEQDAPAPAPAPAPLGLQWYSSLGEVVDELGAGAVEHVDCPVCGGESRARLFEKQGFRLHRCRACAHVYVSPRIRLDLQLRMARELEASDDDNEFLEVQRIFAEPICHLIRLRSPGRRLLDLGCGRGYIINLARAYGFEVYGLDSSAHLTQQLEPAHGRRIRCAALGVDAIPWQGFDVVVMTHVLEHLVDPGGVLDEVWNALNPGGILYVAVPDMDSLQFRIFGKHWDVVNPLVHLQYFGERSLRRLLLEHGFADTERIEYPSLPRELTPKWMRLMRRLGGDEAGELAMIAQRPAIERLLEVPDASEPPPVS